MVVARPPLLERVHPMTRLLPPTGRLAGCLTFAMLLLGLSGQAALAGWHKHGAPAGCACDNCFGYHPHVWSMPTVESVSGPRPVAYDVYRITWRPWPAECQPDVMIVPQPVTVERDTMLHAPTHLAPAPAPTKPDSLPTTPPAKPTMAPRR
jgi:hypothetical protein